MAVANDFSRLSTTTVALHWIIAVGLVAMLAFGIYVEQVPSGPDKTALIQVHKSFGMILGALALVRLGWRMYEGFPPPINGRQDWEQKLARFTHIGLLLAVIAMPIAGATASLAYARDVKVFGVEVIPQLLTEKNEALNELAGTAHFLIAIFIGILILLHIAGALKHHFVDRDGTLARMLPLIERAR